MLFSGYAKFAYHVKGFREQGSQGYGDRLMAPRTLVAGMAAAVLTVATQAWAHFPAPLVPTALVEDVKGATAGIEFMDYVGSGQMIKLEPGDVLVLSYL